MNTTYYRLLSFTLTSDFAILKSMMSKRKKKVDFVLILWNTPYLNTGVCSTVAKKKCLKTWRMCCFWRICFLADMMKLAVMLTFILKAKLGFFVLIWVFFVPLLVKSVFFCQKLTIQVFLVVSDINIKDFNSITCYRLEFVGTIIKLIILTSTITK